MHKTIHITVHNDSNIFKTKLDSPTLLPSEEDTIKSLLRSLVEEDSFKFKHIKAALENKYSICIDVIDNEVPKEQEVPFGGGGSSGSTRGSNATSGMPQQYR